MSDPVKCLSLFAGIGGFEVGTSPCGFCFTNTLERDEKCCATLNANRAFTGAAERDIQPVDIMQVEPGDFSEERIDYIVGGPPCQSFSAAGRRAGGVAGTSDERGSLFYYYCKYVDHFRPKAFVFENVRGILSSRQGEDFKLICASFEKVGYRLFWRVLNAADYGVPQQRERVFLVGVRRDLKAAFQFPRPTHGPDSPDKLPYVTVREALADITDENELVPPYGGKYGHLLPDIPPGENYRFYTEEMGHPHPLFAWRSKFSNFLYKVDPDDISKTIIAYQGRYDGPFHWHNRKLTVEELKRIQGFPREYQIPQNYTEGVKQLGNSVCPPVARQLGLALRYQIEGLEEFKVPLVGAEESLSFDTMKGRRARKTREKKAAGTVNNGQTSLFDRAGDQLDECAAERKRRTFQGHKIVWRFAGGELFITIDRTRAAPAATLELSFSGRVAARFRRVRVDLFAKAMTDGDLTLMWNEIHRAVSEYTTYGSLMPLYGHFTEPYPKFRIAFTSNSGCNAVKFQKVALEDRYRTKILNYAAFPYQVADYEAYFDRMRQCGFDVRTHQTNRTVPAGSFRICYPFTLPSDWKDATPWTSSKGGRHMDTKHCRIKNELDELIVRTGSYDKEKLPDRLLDCLSRWKWGKYGWVSPASLMFTAAWRKHYYPEVDCCKIWASDENNMSIPGGYSIRSEDEDISIPLLAKYDLCEGFCSPNSGMQGSRAIEKMRALKRLNRDFDSAQRTVFDLKLFAAIMNEIDGLSGPESMELMKYFICTAKQIKARRDEVNKTLNQDHDVSFALMELLAGVHDPELTKCVAAACLQAVFGGRGLTVSGVEDHKTAADARAGKPGDLTIEKDGVPLLAIEVKDKTQRIDWSNIERAKRIISACPSLKGFIFVLESRDAATDRSVNEMVRSYQLAEGKGKLISVMSLFSLHQLAAPIEPERDIINRTSRLITLAPAIKPETREMWLSRIDGTGTKA